MPAVSSFIAVAVGISSIGAGVVARKQASKARAAQAAAQREGQAITEASQQNVNRTSRRKALREERVRRARIIQGAETAGISTGSGALSAPGILGTHVAAAFSNQASSTRAARGVGRTNQAAAQAGVTAAEAIATGQLFSSIATQVGAGANKLDLFKNDLFSTRQQGGGGGE